MNAPNLLETRMVRMLTNNEVMTSGDLAMHCNSKEHEVQAILDRWEETAYAARLDNDEWTLTR